MGGMGSNGLTSARHDVLEHSLSKRYPESYDAATPDELVYSGSKLLPTYRWYATGCGAPDPLSYAYLCSDHQAILDELRPEIHGMVHCSGGAQTKVLHFVEGKHVIKDNMFAIPPLFELIQKESGTPWSEMYKVFNMGHRMELYVSAEHAARIIEISESFGVPARSSGVSKLQRRITSLSTPHSECLTTNNSYSIDLNGNGKRPA